MLANMIAAICGLQSKADQIQIVVDEKLRTVFIRQGDKYTDEEFPPEDRGGVLQGFRSFLDAILDPEICEKPEVYHNDDAMVVLCDRDDRSQRITMPLTKSDQFLAILKLSYGDLSFTPAQLVKYLRFDMSEGDGVEAMIKAVRRIDFTRQSVGNSSVEHGRESLGKSVEASVQQADNIPESLAFEVPVYSNSGLLNLTRVRIEMGVHIDLELQKLSIRPLAGQIDRARVTAHAAIANEFRKEAPKVPVFHGRP